VRSNRIVASLRARTWSCGSASLVWYLHVECPDDASASAEPASAAAASPLPEPPADEGEEEIDRSDLLSELTFDMPIAEQSVSVDESQLISTKRDQVIKTWAAGNVIPLAATWLSPNQATGDTLDHVLSHPEFVNRMDPEDAASIHREQKLMKVQFVERVMADLHVEGKGVWLVSKDCELDRRPPEDTVIVRVDSVRSAANVPQTTRPFLDNTEYVELRSPARYVQTLAVALLALMIECR